MALHQPDPEFVRSGRAQANFRLALRIALALVVLLWGILLVDTMFNLHLNRFGLRPGSLQGLLGVVTAPLLHGGAGHLFNNSIPLLVALTASLYLYPNAALRVVPLVWLGSGLLGWFIGRHSLHIGASGLLYGLLAFVFVSGVLRRDMRSVAVSLLVWFLYGTMIWGILPIRPNMSWELHLSGGAIGILLAWLYRKWDRVPLKRYAWEHDDSVPEWYPEDTGGTFELPPGGEGKPSAPDAPADKTLENKYD
jgi:membrane associated rhomboid family serine protease